MTIDAVGLNVNQYGGLWSIAFGAPVIVARTGAQFDPFTIACHAIFLPVLLVTVQSCSYVILPGRSKTNSGVLLTAQGFLANVSVEAERICQIIPSGLSIWERC